jgi:hypothetical protein
MPTAPGGTVTDMFHAVAKEYIPNSENMSTEELKNVSTPLLATQKSLALTNDLYVTNLTTWPRAKEGSRDH